MPIVINPFTGEVEVAGNNRMVLNPVTGMQEMRTNGKTGIDIFSGNFMRFSGSSTSTSPPPPSISYNFYVDGVNGNDSNDGSTSATAFKSLSRCNLSFSGNSASITILAMSGSFQGPGLLLSTTNKVALYCAPGCLFDSSSWGSGITVQNNSAFYGFLNGSKWMGTSVGSANGIGGFDNCIIIISGSGPGGTKTEFTQFDDGFSLHGAPGSLSQVIVEDINFNKCSKAAATHVNSSWGVHKNCIFDGLSGAVLGIVSDQSTQASYFESCSFIPANSLQTIEVNYAKNCMIGSLSLACTYSFQKSFFTGSASIVDSFVNISADAPRSGINFFERNYGYFSFRIRGTASSGSLIIKDSIFRRRGNATIQSNNFADGAFDAVDGNWYGGNVFLTNTILYGYSNAYKFASSSQQTHMNNSWSVANCALFFNNTNFQSGLTLGSNLITINPMIGSGSIVSLQDWGYKASSPCIGSGIGGANIGLPSSSNLDTLTLPSSISGLSAWWMSTSGVDFSSSAVANWYDVSGNSIVAHQATAANRPAYSVSGLNVSGFPFLTFDGTNDSFSTNLLNTSTSDFTMIVVGTTNTGGRSVWSSYSSANGSGTPYVQTVGSSTSLRVYSGRRGPGSEYTFTPDTNILIASGSYNLPQSCFMATVRFGRNSTSTQFNWSSSGLSFSTIVTGGALPSASLLPVNWWLGANPAGGSPFQGSMTEMIIYPYLISDSNVADLSNYLSTKYSISR